MVENNFESNLIMPYVGSCAIGFASSSLSFWMTCTLSQIIQNSLNITCASPISRIYGFLTIILGSLVASETMKIHNFLEQSSPYLTSLPKFTYPNETIYKYQNSISAYQIKDVILGLIIFRLLGGRFYSTSPSNLLSPGVFSRYHYSTSAELGEYASINLREILKQFGRYNGCHHCGKRNLNSINENWIADHQPPNAPLIKKKNTFIGKIQRIINRIFTGKYQNQRFYPQCSECSKKQAECLRHQKKSKSILHLNILRPYHLTGGIMYILRTFETTKWDKVFHT